MRSLSMSETLRWNSSARRQAGCILHHQHGPVHQVLGGSNKPRHLLIWASASDAWETECDREGTVALPRWDSA